MNKNFHGLRHGEALLAPVNSIPAGKKVKGTAYVLAPSDAGHDHVLQGNGFEVTELDDGQIFVEVKAPTEIAHRKTHDSHRTLTIPPSTLERYLMVEYNPAADAITVVRD